MENDFFEETLKSIEEQKGFGSLRFDNLNNIVGIKGMTLEIEDLSKPNFSYFKASVNGIEEEGFTRNEAIEKAFAKAGNEHLNKLNQLEKVASNAIKDLISHTTEEFFDFKIQYEGKSKLVLLVDEG